MNTQILVRFPNPNIASLVWAGLVPPTPAHKAGGGSSVIHTCDKGYSHRVSRELLEVTGRCVIGKVSSAEGEEKWGQCSSLWNASAAEESV